MTEQIARVQQALETVVASGQVPGIVVMMARGNASPVTVVVGNDADGTPLTAESIFPVASVTKMATALVLLRLVDDNALHLDDLLSDHLPQAAAAQPGVTIRSLLCHTSGMPVDVDQNDAPYGPGLDWHVLAAACLRTPLEAAPDTRVQYSNVAYGLLALMAERLTGEDFGDLLQHMVLDALGIVGYLGDEPHAPTVQLARVRSRFAETEFEPYNTAFWRSLALPWGGLYTTPAGALEIVRAFNGNLLTPALRAEAVRSHTKGLAGGFAAPLWWDVCEWGLGPEVRGQKAPHWIHESFGPTSFGHSGASGCLAWYDPTTDLAFALHGARPADSGWLLRRGPALTEAIYAWGRESQPNGASSE